MRQSIVAFRSEAVIFWKHALATPAVLALATDKGGSSVASAKTARKITASQRRATKGKETKLSPRVFFEQQYAVFSYLESPDFRRPTHGPSEFWRIRLRKCLRGDTLLVFFEKEEIAFEEMVCRDARTSVD